MNQLDRPNALTWGIVAVLSLVNCCSSASATTSTVRAGFMTNPAITANPVVAGVNAVVPSIKIAQATGNQLSPAQKAQLTQLPIPIVAPTYLPAGFRLIQATGERGQYVNGDDDSGYTIAYKGPGNTCIKLYSSQDGPRGQAAKVVKTTFGAVRIFVQKTQNRPFIYSFIPIAGNPSLTSGGSMLDSATKNRWQPCNAVSMDEYVRVLQSLTVVK